METKEKNNLIIIYLLIIISLFLTILIIPNYFSEYAKLINTIIWVVICSFSISVSSEHNRFKAKKEKIKTVIIILIIYYIIYFLSGLFLGYQRSPYSQNIIVVLKNILFVLGLAILQEYVRDKLVNNTKSLNLMVIITVAFILLNIDFGNAAANMKTNEEIFKYISSTIFPICIEQCLFTYFAKTGGYQLIYAYRIPVTLVNILVPIFPDMDWLILTTIKSILILLLFVFINYEHDMKINRYTRKELKRNKPENIVPLAIIIVLIVLFISGIFPIKPFAIMSNSMYPQIKRGDIAVVQEIKNIEEIKEGEVIAYQLDKSMVVHRVVKIETNTEGKILITTKGDNNETNDAKQVAEDQVRGKVKFIIKYLGYPSVWFSEKVLYNKSSIDT